MVKNRMLKVALIGRPNVGKSTLFNKLTGKYHAITDSNVTTVDCQENIVKYNKDKFTIIDTAGSNNLHKVLEYSKDVIENADLILFVTSFKEGVIEWDRKIAKFIIQNKLPCIHVINKCEAFLEEYSSNDDIFKKEYLGLGNPIPISGEQNININEVLNSITPLLNFKKLQNELEDQQLELKYKKKESLGIEPKIEIEKDLEKYNDKIYDDIRLSFVGKANVGKSSLINSLLGRERVFTHNEAGTTRDTIKIDCIYKKQRFVIADTAGLRKEKFLSSRIHLLSQQDTISTIKYSNIAILVVDSNIGLTQEDIRIASRIEKEGRSLIIAANKWDLVKNPYDTADKIERSILKSLSQIKGLMVVICSAKQGKNLKLLLDKAIQCFNGWNTRISTGQLNRFLQKFLSTQHIPAIFPKLNYISQIKIRPPTFAIFYTKARKLPRSYERMIVNAIREEFKLDGVPFRVIERSQIVDKLERKKEKQKEMKEFDKKNDQLKNLHI